MSAPSGGLTQNEWKLKLTQVFKARKVITFHFSTEFLGKSSEILSFYL